MKRLLAIILVLCMVLVPLTALAAQIVTYATVNVTISNGTAYFVPVGGTTKYYGGQIPAYYTEGGTVNDYHYNLKIEPKKNYEIVSVKWAELDITADWATHDIIFNADTPSANSFVITLKHGEGKLVTYMTDDQNAERKGYGSITPAITDDISGKVTFEAHVKNAIMTEWRINGSADLSAYKASGIVVSVDGRKITIDTDIVYDGNETIRLAAVIDAHVGSIKGEVDALNNGGTVSVAWLSANSAKITATAKPGHMFAYWSELPDEVVITTSAGKRASTEDNPAEGMRSQTLYVTGIDTSSALVFQAAFIRTSGDFTTKTSDATAGKSDNPQTGDVGHVAVWTLIALLALGAAAVAVKKVFVR